MTGNASAMILTCIDPRFGDIVSDYIENVGLWGDHDQCSLAGCSLGYNTGLKRPINCCWMETFDDQIELAIKLHHIHTIILVDHLDCGAYKAFYELEKDDNVSLHLINLNKAVAQLRSKYSHNLRGELITYQIKICDLKWGVIDYTHLLYT